MRKVKVKVEVELTINVDEGVEIQQVIDEMDYTFTAQNNGATIKDTEILGHEVIDSK